MKIYQGVPVVLEVPDNPVFHRRLARVETVTEWGAHVSLEADGVMKTFRALHSEMKPVHTQGPSVKDEGCTGDSCDDCGSFRMQRFGSCLRCLECGANGGCG